MTSPPSPVLEALRLRRWALDTLGGARSPAPVASPEGWELFLGRESCASRLRQAAGDSAPPPLRAAADTDTQLILLLRAELADLLALAAPLRLRPVILKGGAALNDPARAVRAKDIDLLLDPAGARTLVATMDAAGWRAAAKGTGHHFGERVRQGRPPVEVHPSEGTDLMGLGAEVERRAVPHPALPGARLLAPEDRVRQLVIHQTVQHTAYRGRLRDLLLLADALAEAPRVDPARWLLRPAELAAAEKVLAMARAINARETPRDQFEELAALWYGMDLAARGKKEAPLRQALANWVFDFAIGEGAAWRRWARSWTGRLEDRSLVRTSARMLWLPYVILYAWLTARLHLRRARAAVASLPE